MFLIYQFSHLSQFSQGSIQIRLKIENAVASEKEAGSFLEGHFSVFH